MGKGWGSDWERWINQWDAPVVTLEPFHQQNRQLFVKFSNGFVSLIKPRMLKNFTGCFIIQDIERILHKRRKAKHLYPESESLQYLSDWQCNKKSGGLDKAGMQDIGRTCCQGLQLSPRNLDFYKWNGNWFHWTEVQITIYYVIRHWLCFHAIICTQCQLQW